MIERVQADPAGIVQATDQIREYLISNRIKGRELTRSVLVVEEALGSLACHVSGDDPVIEVRTGRFLGNITIELSAPGSEYALEDNMASASVEMNDEVGIEEQDQIRNIILRSLTDDLKYVHRNGVNSIRMTVVRSRQMLFYMTLIAFISAVALGLLLKAFGTDAFNTGLDQYLLEPVKTMFMNALKMIVAPVVFFSIVSAVGRFTNLSELGKIGGKVFSLYALTTVLAIGVGFGMFYLIQPGQPGSFGVEMTEEAEAITSVSRDGVNLIDMIVGIVPQSIVEPFLTNNMMQLIFMALLTGIATGLIGKYSATLRDIFEALCELFLKITTMVIKLMPIVVFCSMLSLTLNTGVKTLWSIAGIFGTVVAGLGVMMLIYSVMMILIGRLNPLSFFRKYAPTMMQVFTLSSSNASIPVNMEVCENKLGISSKVFGLSIPLGATLNMDGGCIQMGIFVLGLAKLYGVDVPVSSLITLAFTIFVMSVGTPGIPCSSLISLAALIAQVGIPADSIVLVMGIAPIVSMFLTMSNCLGDVAVTAIVARTTGNMDHEVYKDPSR